MIHRIGNIFEQLCSGIEEGAVGAGAQLVFAPIDAAVSEDIPLLPSGFRVIPVDSSVVVSVPGPYSDMLVVAA